MRNARITKEIREYAAEIGCEIIRAKSYAEGKHRLIGIHLLLPSQHELESALIQAERDMFPRVVIHTFDSWVPGAMKRSPRKLS
jgi:hypothetical protein